MAYSREFLEEFRKTLMETIESVERENAKLSAKIDNIRERSELNSEHEDEQKFLEELRLSEIINGLAFRNAKKKVLGDKFFKITADICCDKEEYPLEVTVEVSSGKVEAFSLAIGDRSSLAEIKQDLIPLIQDLNLTHTLNAIASFSRMNAVRMEILDNIVSHYSEFFKVEVKIRNANDGSVVPDSVVVTALNRQRGDKYFEVMWNLKWNYGKLSIEHVFIVTQHQDQLALSERLVCKLNKLERGGFVEKKRSKLVKVWENIVSLVADE